MDFEVKPLPVGIGVALRGADAWPELGPGCSLHTPTNPWHWPQGVGRGGGALWQLTLQLSRAERSWESFAAAALCLPVLWAEFWEQAQSKL